MKNLKPWYEKDADKLGFFMIKDTKKNKNKRFKEKDLVWTGIVGKNREACYDTSEN